MPRRPQSTPKSSSRSSSKSSSSYPGERELVVIATSEAGLRATPSGLASVRALDTAPLSQILGKHGASMRPLFGASEERLAFAVAALPPTAVVPDLATYYRVDAPEERLDDLAYELRSHAAVEAAYVKPPAEPPQINDMLPSAEAAPPATPDLTARQNYLDAAPGGIDARFAWTQAGGRGANVRIVDVEGAWRFSHEDLTQNQGGVVGGTPSTDIGWRNHGTAVLGEFSGDANGVGITGICSDANVSAISIFGGPGSAGAITAAANRLAAGDILLIELHRPGPRNNFQNRDDQNGYIAVEWWPDDFAAIKFATAKGVIVVEAGGNGAQNLDDPLYSTPATGFPAGWTNPFNRANRDSGAILVGAGAPPPGTHGRNIHGPDRSRLDFSNFGAAVDVQAWGREVTTCGYGDLQGGMNEDLWYTDVFSGTSSASPIIVGTIGCLQGIVRARGLTLLTPARVRSLFRSTGSPQQDAPGRPATQRIGNRPNLRALVAALGVVVVGKTPAKELKDSHKDGKELKEPKEFKDLKDGHKDGKDKDGKDKEKEIKEKEIKEPKEAKEVRKDTKEKDFKDKDVKEVKDLKDAHKDTKEPKEVKDLKDGRKETKELKELKEKEKEKEKDKEKEKEKEKDKEKEKEKEKEREKDKDILDRPPADFGGDDVRERLARVEQTLVQLVHFISPELRPDLSASALNNEEDRQAAAALSNELDRQAQEAKAAKDSKDSKDLDKTSER